MKLPEKFVDDMKLLLGSEFNDYIDSYDEPRWYGLRINEQKISVEEFLTISPFELTPIPWINNGFYYDGEREKPGKHPYYFAGLYYLQEPSAMTPANRLPIEDDDIVLDLCAAPGGKTTELGAKLNNTGLLISNDISNSRAKILLKNLELFGYQNICVLSEDPSKMVPLFRNYFDKILVDAPCSGEGMFRKDTKMIKSWEEEGPKFYCEIQKELILQATDMLKPGGKILYSTCTFNRDENEGTVTYLLEERPEMHLIDIDGYEGFCKGYDTQGKSIRMWPHHLQGEGHFLALFEKDFDCDSSTETFKSSRKSRVDKLKQIKKVPDELKEFLESINRTFQSTDFYILGEKIYYLENMPELSNMRVLRNGLLIGDLKKNRFEPSQALAMNLKKEEFNFSIDFSSDDIRVLKYLKGETLDLEDKVQNKDKGFALVCVDGYPLGFGKVSNQSLKNKYSVGWRIQ